MRHIFWMGFLASAGIYWAVRQPEPPPSLTTAAKKTQALLALWNPLPKTDPRSPVVVMPVAEEAVEPILVLPEMESSPEPTLVADLNVKVVSNNFDFIAGSTMAVSVTDAVRPETGREPRLWMSYAEEDGDLAMRRKIEWETLVARENVAGATGDNMAGLDLEETQEPPLHDLTPLHGPHEMECPFPGRFSSPSR